MVPCLLLQRDMLGIRKGNSLGSTARIHCLCELQHPSAQQRGLLTSIFSRRGCRSWSTGLFSPVAIEKQSCSGCRCLTMAPTACQLQAGSCQAAPIQTGHSFDLGLCVFRSALRGKLSGQQL